MCVPVGVLVVGTRWGLKDTVVYRAQACPVSGIHSCVVFVGGVVCFAHGRDGVDKEGNYKKQQTFLHRGGVQEFVELMCKDKQLLHPEMKVGLFLYKIGNGGYGGISGAIPRPGWTGSSARKVTRAVAIDLAAVYDSTGTALERRAVSLFSFTRCEICLLQGG